MTRFVRSFLAMSIVASNAMAMAAEKPQLTRLNPSGVPIGKTTEIEATGSFKDWPVQIWCSSPDIVWKCGEKPGTFQVESPTTHPSEIAWVRFFNEAGATPAKPFLVVPNDVEPETNPNDRITQVEKSLPPNVLAFGSLDKSSDVDHVRIELQENVPFYAIVDAARSLKSPLDAHLQLLDSRGHVITENLDTFGYDPAIAYTPKSSGIHYLRIFGFPIATDSTISFSGGGEWVYSLFWSEGPLPLTVHETNRFTMHLPGDEKQHSVTRADAKELPFLQSVIQIISQPKEIHYYKLPAKHGKFLRLKLQSQSIGSPLDPVLTIINHEEKSVTQVDDIATSRDSMLVWQMPNEGEFWVKVTDFHGQGGDGHSYYLHAEELSPTLESSLASEIFEGKAKQELEIAVPLTRIAAWTGEAEIVATGLPEGASLTNTKVAITPDGPASHAIKVSVPDAWQGPLQLQLKIADSESAVPIDGPNSISPWLSITP